MADRVDVAAALGRALAAHPHERAGQVLFNALDARGLARQADGSPRDLFYVDDATLAEALEDYGRS